MTTVTEERVAAVTEERVAVNHVTVWQLIRRLTNQSLRLIRQELELARTELGEKAATYGRNVGYLAAGGLVAFAGVMVLLAAAVAGLYVGLNTVLPWYHAAWISPLAVGLVVAIIGYAMVQKAISTIKRTSPVPQQTVETMRENKEWLQNEMK